jgi:hypothetical protein
MALPPGPSKRETAARWTGGEPNFGLPAGLVNGAHLVTITDTAGKVLGTATLTLSAFLTPSPASGAPGTSATVTGASDAIAAGSTVTTYLDSTSQGTGAATGTGTITSSFTVPGGWVPTGIT